MRKVNIYEAKTHFSELVEAASAGEEIIIARAGKPMARLCALGEKARPRKAGCLKGKFSVSEDFDAPLPDDLLEAFGGK